MPGGSVLAGCSVRCNIIVLYEVVRSLPGEWGSGSVEGHLSGILATLSKGFSPNRPTGPIRSSSRIVCICMYVCIYMSPSHAIFVEASHWPTGHMTRFQASHWSKKKCSQLDQNNFYFYYFFFLPFFSRPLIGPQVT